MKDSHVDLVALIFVVFLGAAVANPLFTTHSRSRADILVCQANLRDIGRAYQIWGDDHAELAPYLVPAAEGGLRGHPLSVNPYIQFAWVSNGLSSPKVFVCPADTNITRRAKDFSTNPDGGFMHPAYANNAVGYMLSFHAQRYSPSSILSGDRNIQPIQIEGCSYAGFSARRMDAGPGALDSQWTNEIHWLKGNLLFNDGSAEETTTDQLRAKLRSQDGVPDDFQARIHATFPR